jgi:hypothetical protein
MNGRRLAWPMPRRVRPSRWIAALLLLVATAAAQDATVTGTIEGRVGDTPMVWYTLQFEVEGALQDTVEVEDYGFQVDVTIQGHVEPRFLMREALVISAGFGALTGCPCTADFVEVFYLAEGSMFRNVYRAEEGSLVVASAEHLGRVLAVQRRRVAQRRRGCGPSLIGNPTWRIRPIVGWSNSSSMSRAATCGCSNTSSSSRTGATGTPRRRPAAQNAAARPTPGWRGRRGRLVERQVDALALAGAVAVEERGADRERRLAAGQLVDHGDADLERPPALLAVDRHEPADGLDDGVVAGEVRRRPRPSVAGDAAVHEPRVERPQHVLVPEAPLLHRPDPEVLDHHVGRPRPAASAPRARRSGGSRARRRACCGWCRCSTRSRRRPTAGPSGGCRRRRAPRP